MIKSKLKVIAILLSVVIVAVTIAGCGQKQTEQTQTTQAAASTTAAVSQETTYPIKTDETLTWWSPLNGNLSATTQNLADTPIGKEIEKEIGVKIKYTSGSPDPDTCTQELNLLLASGSLPDIIEYGWLTFPGGPEKVMKDGYILKLNDVIDQYASNLKKYMADNPDIAKRVKTDSGALYNFPFIMQDKMLLTTSGPIVRKDWLDDLGLAVPETMDDWYNMLKEFKDKKNATIPLTYESWMFDEESVFSGAYGVGSGSYDSGTPFYVDNGQVKYGPMESQYKDFLTTLNKWYTEGLLDKNIAAVDKKTVTLQMTTGKSGASLGYAGSRLGVWLPAGKEVDPKYDLIAAPYPVLNKGDKAKFAQVSDYYSGNGAAITTQCKDVALAVKALDYAFSEKGHLMYNFGVEGESYTMVDGQPKYTDLILKNPDKTAPAQMIAQYNLNRGVQDPSYLLQFYALDQQKNALSTWSNTDAMNYMLPPVTPTSDESDKLASVMDQVSTYQKEMFWKFVMGTEPISNFDSYVDQIKKLGIVDALKINQDALDRFNKR